MKNLKLILSFVAASGLLFVGEASAQWTNKTVPGMSVFETSMGSTVANYASSQKATTVKQTATGSLTKTTVGLILDGKAINVVNKVATKGSHVGTYMSSQAAAGIMQTATGASENLNNQGGMN